MSASTTNHRVPAPRDRENDTPQAAAQRAEFARERTGVSLEHVTRYSFDPSHHDGD
ncbi:MAG: hypothetical protein WBP81_31995 [Solirubrobacteraceae bacterium]